MITVNLGEIPEEGLRLSGETQQDIFDLPETERDALPAGPVSYDLYLSEAGSGLILAQGRLKAPFRLRCVACLEEFPFTLQWNDYVAEFEIPAAGQLDLTERIREDLLLELPAYPHCDRDNDAPDHVCPAAGKFGASGPLPGSGPSAWDALDGFSSSSD
ncbi:MAG: hypothetical protein KDM63_13760 [Verrucomicrobiae bacterium]|nr:hypothetical protein [Verrucomicrobiae bacterium]MCB1088111.1 hypothetical protein [Verrucomicrobiae bacterium]MCB1090693.1 hypothetical protein [Verrucomicrobiae bacterium]